SALSGAIVPPRTATILGCLDGLPASLAPFGARARDLRLHRSRPRRLARRPARARAVGSRAILDRGRRRGVLPAPARADERRGARQVRLPLHRPRRVGTVSPAGAPDLLLRA